MKSYAKTRKSFLAIALLLTMVLALASCGTPAPAPTPAPAASGEPAAPATPAPINFPTKPIRIIVPFTAGGASDLNARIIADIINQEKLFPHPVIIINISGSNCAEGFNAVLTSDADGHTLFCTQTITLQSQHQMGSLPYSFTELDPLAQAYDMPTLLVASADEPYDTVDEMLAYAAANPGEVVFCYSGVGASTHLAMETFFNAVGVEYRDMFKLHSISGGAETTAAHLGKQIDVRFATAGDTVKYVESGDFKLLATTASERSPDYPDVPTLWDLGYEAEFVNKQGIFMPKGVPAGVVELLTDAIEKAVATDRFKEYCETAGLDPKFRDSTDFGAALAVDDAMITVLVEQIKERS